MRVSPQQLCYPNVMPDFEGTLFVRSPDLLSVELSVTRLEAFALAVRMEIEAVCTSAGRIKYFRHLPEEERPPVSQETAKTPKSPNGGFGAALQCYYEEEINGTLVGTLGKARLAPLKPSDWSPTSPSCRIVRWSDKDGFNPNRFNPDMVYHKKFVGPLTPPMRAVDMLVSSGSST